MRNKREKFIYIFIILLSTGVFADSFGDWLTSWGTTKALNLTEPVIRQKLLYEFQTQMDSIMPLENNYVKIGTNMLWMFPLPDFTIAVRAYKEKKYIPGVTIGGTYWDLIWPRLSFVKAQVPALDDYGIKFKGKSYFITLSKTVKKNVRFFGGYKYYSGQFGVNIDSGAISGIDGDLKFDFSVNNGAFLYMGLKYNFSKTGSFVTYTGYDINNHFFGLKMFYSWNFFDIGFILFPDPTLINIYPIMRFHIVI